MKSKKYKIGLVGLGYVGLPLAVEFSKHFEVVGYDINQSRVSQLKNDIDTTLEISEDTLSNCLNSTHSKDQIGLSLSNQIESIAECNFYIVTVPTPINHAKQPDLTPLESASKALGSILKPSDIVVYESTVYPGVTEEVCVPILERVSGLFMNKDFFVGYSPERINPGDKDHTVGSILKVTSGSNKEAAQVIDEVYKTAISAGTFLASSIKVAEAAKVIENSQRDINIAFVNELAKIFKKIGIDTTEVLEAAGTKWNFLKFKPGLVGGHCIGVDPYYLAQKAQSVGYHPEMILAGRRLNDSMGKFIADEVIKMMVKRGVHIKDSKVLVLGVTFKENCPDIRNTRVVDIIEELHSYGTDVAVYDMWANPKEVIEEFGFELLKELPNEENIYNAVVLAVSHREFADINLRAMLKENGVLFDVKSFLPKDMVDGRL